MPTLTNGGGLLLACTILVAAWIIWYAHRDWKQADRLADQRAQQRASQAKRHALDTLPICVAEQVRFGPGYMLGAAIEHERGQCTCTTADAELDQMIGGAR